MTSLQTIYSRYRIQVMRSGTVKNGTFSSYSYHSFFCLSIHRNMQVMCHLQGQSEITTFPDIISILQSRPSKSGVALKKLNDIIFSHDCLSLRLSPGPSRCGTAEKKEGRVVGVRVGVPGGDFKIEPHPSFSLVSLGKRTIILYLFIKVTFFFLPRIMPHIDCHSLSLDIILLEGRHQPGFMQYIGVHVHNNAPITCLFFSFPQMQCTSSLGYCASPYWSRSKCLMHHFNMYN